MRSTQDLGKKGHLGSKDYAEQRCFSGYSRYFLETHEEFRQVLESYKGYACSAARQIQAGAFHPTIRGAQDGGCDYCDYAQICRVDHQRMREHEANSPM